MRCVYVIYIIVNYVSYRDLTASGRPEVSFEPKSYQKWGDFLFICSFIHSYIHSFDNSTKSSPTMGQRLCLLKRLQASWRRNARAAHYFVSWNCLQLWDQLAFNVNKCGKKLSVLTQFVVVLSSPASQIFLEREEDAGNTIVFAAQLGTCDFVAQKIQQFLLRHRDHSWGEEFLLGRLEIALCSTFFWHMLIMQGSW